MQNVGADDEAFKDDDDAVEAEDQAETPFVVSGDGYGEHRADEGNHAAEGGDDLEQAAEDCPEWSEGDADQLQSDQPENSYDEGVERGGAPPVE